MTLVRSAMFAALLALPVLASAGDPATDSFHRMLSHRPDGAAPVSPGSPVADPLTLAIRAAIERDGGTLPAPRPLEADPVMAGFARMLAHAPNGATPPLPANAGTDPLVAAVVLPLLRSGHIQFASSPQRSGG